MISENPNVSLGIVDCSLYTRRVKLNEDYHKKRMSQLAYAPVEYNYMERLAKTFIIPARQNQFIQENLFNNAPIRRIAIAMKSKSAFTGSFAENPLWYQQFILRDIKCIKLGYSSAQCIKIGYSSAQCIKIGYSSAQRIKIGYSSAQCIKIGYSSVQCIKIGYSWAQFSKIGYSSAMY